MKECERRRRNLVQVTKQRVPRSRFRRPIENNQVSSEGDWIGEVAVMEILLMPSPICTKEIVGNSGRRWLIEEKDQFGSNKTQEKTGALQTSTVLAGIQFVALARGVLVTGKKGRK